MTFSRQHDLNTIFLLKKLSMWVVWRRAVCDKKETCENKHNLSTSLDQLVAGFPVLHLNHLSFYG